MNEQHYSYFHIKLHFQILASLRVEKEIYSGPEHSILPLGKSPWEQVAMA